MPGLSFIRLDTHQYSRQYLGLIFLRRSNPRKNRYNTDCVHRNTRSQHVLEKNSFVFSHEDELLQYYSLSK